MKEYLNQDQLIARQNVYVLKIFSDDFNVHKKSLKFLPTEQMISM
jgi:hypothetical protein